MRLMPFLLMGLLMGLSWSPPGAAQRAQIPLTLDHPFLESLLREEVFTRAGDSLRINDDGSGCQYLELREPRVRAGDGALVLVTRAEARAGRAVAGRCLLALNWHGQIEFTQKPEVGDDGRSVVMRTASWRALRPDGSEDTVSTTVGRWLEQFLPVDLERTRVDLTQPMSQLQEFLTLASALESEEKTRQWLDTLAIDAVSAGANGATLTLGLDVPAVEAPPARAEPALDAGELARLEQRLDLVDAFYTNTIKSAASGPGEASAAALLEVLLELRRDVVAILSEGRHSDRDPARALFVSAWEGLAPIVRDLAGEQADHDSGLRYLTFVGAGDALRALDDMGGAVGIEVTSDGLRRLARMIVPGSDGDDPLRHDEAVDWELRKSLGFGEPLPPPAHYDATSSWLDWFIPPAVAAGTLAPAVAERLNNWVPKTGDMDQYLPMVRDVLRHVVAEQLRDSELDAQYHSLFRSLVFATAWQESCWRQFVAENDMRVPMRSGTGDLGMMQINATVWRGFYDLHGLRWDIVYNGRAGADILEQYMLKYAIRHEEHRTTGDPDSLARSAYAAYNGGPRQYDRYRRADAPAYGRKVDALFYDKYQQIKGGKELAVTACYGG